MSKMILSSERKIGEQNNPIINEHLKLEIRTLQNASDPDKLEKLLQVKIWQKEEAVKIEDTKRLVTEEIEILKVELHIGMGKR